jgi:uncharacterized protein (DUF1786 family)
MANPRILAVDVGTGTQDILVFEAGTVIENAVQMVMPSPTMLVAAKVRQATADRRALLLTGVTMGGGPGHWAVEAHLRQGLEVYATPDAARTFDDDLDRVQAMGIRVVDDGEVAQQSSSLRLELRDFYFDAVTEALTAFGVPTEFDAVAVAVFDHGAAPPGYSDRRFRFDYLREQVAGGARLQTFGFLAGAIPARMTRMQAVAQTWTGSAPLFVMDTGPAAVLGALEDPAARAAGRALLVNVGNFHTIAFRMEDGEIRGLFEHHTGELTIEELESYLDQLAAGTISNDRVFDDMGHGALELGPAERPPEIVAVTGPRRGLLRGSRIQTYAAVPHGDMMIAGCFGLLRGVAAHLPEHAPAIEEVLGPPAFEKRV